MLKTFLAAAAFAGMAFMAAGGAQAMPADIGVANSDASIILVSGGCGPFAHRDFYGRCVGNFVRPRPYFAPRPIYRPRCWIQQTYYGPRRVCR